MLNPKFQWFISGYGLLTKRALVDELLGIWRLGEVKEQEEKKDTRQLWAKAREATNKDDSWNFKSDSTTGKEVTVIFQTDIYFKIWKTIKVKYGLEKSRKCFDLSYYSWHQICPFVIAWFLFSWGTPKSLLNLGSAEDGIRKYLDCILMWGRAGKGCWHTAS